MHGQTPIKFLQEGVVTSLAQKYVVAKAEKL
jgi:hypothetical protein